MTTPSEQETRERALKAFGDALGEAWEICAETRKQAWKTYNETCIKARDTCMKAVGVET